MRASDEILAVRAAELYYEDNKTQGEIADYLGITRWKVGRLLLSARESGIVRIEIVHPQARRLPLEREITTAFGLKEAVVIPQVDGEDPLELRSRVAAAAAEYLTNLRPVPRVLGVSWGRTLQDVAQAIRDGWARGISIVQINGGVSVNRKASLAAGTAATLAAKAKGNVTLLPSPAILERKETKLSIESDRMVSSVQDLARNASAFIYSAGSVSEDSVLVQSGYLSADELNVLAERGAVGDVLGRFIDANGNVVDPHLDERTIGITIPELKKAPNTIMVVSGEKKHHVARAAVSNGLCSVLVCDEITAQHVIDESQCTS